VKKPMSQVLEALQQAVAEAAGNVGPAVVGLGRGWGRGSGVVIAPGQVLTVAHVLRGDEVAVTFAGGDVRDGRVLGADPDLDVAVIGVDTGDVTPLAWEPGEAPVAGTAVFALANPGGRGLRTTFGLVSATGRRFRGPRGRRVAGSIEHTAPLPRGSSGGPLVDTGGRLLGLNAVRADGGFILALPTDAGLRRRVDELARGEGAERPRLGVALAPPRVARRMRAAVGLPERDGLLVRGVVDDSPAARAGVERGDLLVGAAGSPLASMDTLFDALDDAGGATLTLAVVRGTEERELEVELSDRG
jgi:S1-C subfamily serine protease